MTIDIKGVSLAAIDERIVTNPALALSREVNKTQKEAVEELKAQADEAKEAAALRASPAEEVAPGESQNDAGSDAAGDQPKDGTAPPTHVNVEA